MTFRYFCMLLILSGLLAPVSVLAQDQRGIRELIKLGIEKNIGLQIEQLNIPISDTEIIQEEAVFDPEAFAATSYSESKSPLAIASFLSTFDNSDEDRLGGEVGLSKNFQSGASASLSLGSERVSDNNITEGLDPRYRTLLLLDLSQPLLRGYGQEVNTTNLQLARNQRQQEALSYLFAAQSVALQVERVSRQLAGQAEVVGLQQEGVDLAEELFKANQRKFDAGVIPISEVQEAETALALRELRLSVAIQQRDQFLEDLNRLLDHALEQNFNASSLFQEPAKPLRLDLPDDSLLYEEARKNRPDLQISQVVIENSALRKEFSANQLKPQLDLRLQAGLNGLSGDKRSGSSSKYSGGWSDSFASTIDQDGHQWSAGLEFSFPLGNRSAKSRYLQAGLIQKQSKYQQRDLESALKTELKLQRLNLVSSIEQVAISERATGLAIKTVDQEQRRMEEGLSDTFRLLFFQNAMIDAKIDRIFSLVQYQLAVAQMNFARGRRQRMRKMNLLRQNSTHGLILMPMAVGIGFDYKPFAWEICGGVR